MHRPAKTRLITAALIAVFSVASITSGLISEGFLEADGCTHYLYARFALEYPVYLVDVWGRPFKTLWYTPAASLFGLPGVRIWSCVTALIIAWIAYSIAKRAELKRPELAAIFLLGQPLFFMHSFSELTELPFAMLLGGSFLAYQSRWWWICALLASLMPLTRPEGFGFIVIFFILLITQKRWWELLLLPIPVIGWSVAGWWLFGSVGNPITWVFDHWPYSGDSVYHAGPIWHFALALALKVLGPPIFLLMVAGFVFRINREFRTRDSTSTREVGTALRFLDHPVQLRHLILAIPLMIFIGHSVLYWLGKMASNGEPRYMLIVAPFWAVLGAVGFDYVIDRFRVHRWALPISMLIAIAPVVIWQISYPTIPLKMMPDWIATRSFASWYTSGDARARYPKLLVSHPGVFYHLDLPTLAPNVVDWNAKNIDDPPPGTILIWHDIYGTFNATSEKGVAFQRLESANWQEVTESILPVEQREIRVFVRD